jgi:hypothetical protein
MERRSIAKLAAQVGGIKLPAHVSIKDNVFALIDDAGNRVHVGPTLNCVVLDFNEKHSRIFWNKEGEYDPEGGPPLCFSDNGIAPSSRALEPQAKSCQPDREGVTGCRWSVWGSATSKKDGGGIPACQNGLKLAIMVCKLEKKEWIPAIPKAPGAVFFLRVPPASLKTIASYGKVVQGLGQQGKLTLPWTGEEVDCDMPYVVTQVTFAGTGALQFKAVGYITEQIDGVIEEIPQGKVDLAVGRDDVPIRGLPAPEARPSEMIYTPMPGDPALPQSAPAIAAPKRGRGRPPKTETEPAVAFEPKPNPQIVTTQDVRDHAAQQQQEAQEAHDDHQAAFGIVESAPEPPQDVLDQFMNLDLK